jgi:hypothetical protein
MIDDLDQPHVRETSRVPGSNLAACRGTSTHWTSDPEQELETHLIYWYAAITSLYKQVFTSS